MEGYPLGSLDHNVPLLVAFGLHANTAKSPHDGASTEQGILLRSDVPSLDTREAQALDEYFKEVDAAGKSWSAAARQEPYRFRIKSVGRSFALPPRKARLPDTVEPLESTPALHSPFSPLSPASALYPDGLINRQWLDKHQELVPSVFLCFYPLTSDPSSVSLQDNSIKSDLNDIKSAIARSGYKTRLAVVLLADGAEPPYSTSDSVSERLENIRKGTALDPKSIFYIPPQESPAELRQVASGILTSLSTTAVEYYKDLARHAKKKRSRGYAPQPTVPPTTGTSHTLSLQDWNFRYDFKSAVFSEFRQEIEAATRAYEQAYEMLLGQEVIEVIPNWNPRWNEARQLADIIVIRCLRLYLRAGSTSLAVRRWRAHRDRMSDLVDRQGRGTNNYGWEAWQARWATVMANLMERIGIPSLAPSALTIYLPPEKNLLAERLEPWDMLHHPGYWYRTAAHHLIARRTLARTMPEEDRKAPESSSTSHAASKAYAYDVYMCPEPYEELPLEGQGVNHTQLIIDNLLAARNQFHSRKQTRLVAELSLECAKEMAGAGLWAEVVLMLQPLWEDMSFRTDLWLNVSEELCWLLRKAAAETGRGDLVVAIDWELMNKRYSSRPQWRYSLAGSLEGVAVDSKPSVSLSDQQVSPLVTASFVFRNKGGRAGEVCKAQVTLSSNALPGSEMLSFTSLRIDFSGSLKPIILEHDGAEASKREKMSFESLVLTEDFSGSTDNEYPVRLRGNCNLSLQPGLTRVLELTIPLREAGEAEATSVLLSNHNDNFDLDFAFNFRPTDPVVGWYVNGSTVSKHARVNARTLQIQPRPPKMEIRVVDLCKNYYAGEPLRLSVELLNAEDETASVKLDVELIGEDLPSFKISFNREEAAGQGEPGELKATGFPLGNIGSSDSVVVQLLIDPSAGPKTYDAVIRASYHLLSDAATPVMQVLPVQLSVVNPFEANYDLVPRLHRDPWPSLFDADGLGAVGDDQGTVGPATGLAQKWCLVCHYASFATEDITVTDMRLTVVSMVGEARCSITEVPQIREGGDVVSPKSMHEAQFDLITQKSSLDDRQAVSLELAFVIDWRRGSHRDGPSNTTTMPVGKYLVLGSEPRVLASAVHAEPEGMGLVHMDITIENPSNHLLTFGLTMEPSNEFAFSGAKQTTMHLLPLSRRTTTYRLYPLVRGAFVRLALVVRDKYFQKVLRIIPTEGMKIDKDGLLVWVPGESSSRGESEDGGGEKGTDAKAGIEGQGA
ncbi:hypothetical protein S40288_03033 [Stachybotrys chartarum IBT 40288]|nr:hypothetical protein S40288_03033 [Stachybotrys chartarum IBT 40288]